MEELMNGMETETVEEIKYIVVKLGDEQYGINISYVDNIVRMQRITRVPKAQNCYIGVINLRGEVVPIMSLRKKFGLEDDEYQSTTRIIIIRTEEDQSMIGFIVDEVQEVVDLEPSKVEKPTFKLDEKNASFLTGIGKKEDDSLISLLDIVAVVENKKEA